MLSVTSIRAERTFGAWRIFLIILLALLFFTLKSSPSSSSLPKLNFGPVEFSFKIYDMISFRFKCIVSAERNGCSKSLYTSLFQLPEKGVHYGSHSWYLLWQKTFCVLLAFLLSQRILPLTAVTQSHHRLHCYCLELPSQFSSETSAP